MCAILGLGFTCRLRWAELLRDEPPSEMSNSLLRQFAHTFTGAIRIADRGAPVGIDSACRPRVGLPVSGACAWAGRAAQYHPLHWGWDGCGPPPRRAVGSGRHDGRVEYGRSPGERLVGDRFGRDA